MLAYASSWMTSWVEMEVYVDEVTGRIHTQDVIHDAGVRKFLDENQADRSSGFNALAHGRRAHEVPITTWTAWRHEWQTKAKPAGWSWDEFRKRKLNDREWSQFRTGAIQTI